MARRGKLKPAADHRAVQHRDHRHLAELDLLEHAMPHARMLRRLRRRCARSVRSRSRPAEKCSPSPWITTALMSFGSACEERLDAEDGGVVERVALLRPRQPQDRDVAAPLRPSARAAKARLRARMCRFLVMASLPSGPETLSSTTIWSSPRRPATGQAELKHLENLDPHRPLARGRHCRCARMRLSQAPAGSAVSNRMKVRK